MNDVQYWIDKLKMEQHPEGGYYKRLYASEENIRTVGLPERFTSTRRLMSCIYFLLTADNFSSFHKLQSDEIWNFYTGQAVKLTTIIARGELNQKLLGPDMEQGQAFQLAVPANTWMAAEIVDDSGFALLGCTVAPGFQFEDWELGERKKLLQLFPKHEEVINRLTRV